MAVLALLTLVVAVGSGIVMDRRGWSTDLYVKFRLLFLIILVQLLLTIAAPFVSTVEQFVLWVVMCSATPGLGILVANVFGVPVPTSMTIYYQRPFIGFFVSITLLSIAMTWVYDNVGGSLLAMVLLHATFNWSQAMFPAIETETGGTVFLVLMLVLVAAIVYHYGFESFGPGRHGATNDQVPTSSQ